MNARKLLIIGCVLVVVVAGISIWWQVRPPPRPAIPARDWYYDLNTKQLFAAAAGQLPPIAAPSGPLPDGSPAGVKAMVFGCQDCSPSDRTVLYLETYPASTRADAEVRRQLAVDGHPPPFRPDAATGKGVLVSDPEVVNWVELASPDGAELTRRVAEKRCPGGAAVRACYPP